ncbi:MAG: LptE family protein [Candidatus Rokubacteria bacterium]|nr:LptE family protein [Candidatus Rokubacteria bacterium]
MMRRTGALLTAALLLGGCGYSVRGTLPEHIKTVAVPVFKNRTVEPAVENTLTRAVVEAFSTNGRLRVVGLEQADAILEGEIVGYEVQAVAFDPRANVRQYRLVVTMNLRFRDVREKKVLFERQGLQERANFQVPSTVSTTIVREETALRAAAVDIARAIVSFTVERF